MSLRTSLPLNWIFHIMVSQIFAFSPFFTVHLMSLHFPRNTLLNRLSNVCMMCMADTWRCRFPIREALRPTVKYIHSIFYHIASWLSRPNLASVFVFLMQITLQSVSHIYFQPLILSSSISVPFLIVWSISFTFFHFFPLLVFTIEMSGFFIHKSISI